MEETLSALVGAVNLILWDYMLIYALLGIGLFFTLYLGAPQITKFGAGFKSVFGGLFSQKDKDDKSLSQFQALAVANIVGEHGDSEFPVWSAANIGMVPLTEWEHNGQKLFTQDVRDSLAHDAMRAAYNVIAGKGSTNYAIGVSASRIAEAFLQGQKPPFRLSMPLKP